MADIPLAQWSCTVVRDPTTDVMAVTCGRCGAVAETEYMPPPLCSVCFPDLPDLSFLDADTPDRA